jgi:virginiamycin B lyase
MRQNQSLRMSDILRDGIPGVGGGGRKRSSQGWLTAAGIALLVCLSCSAYLACLPISARAQETPGSIQLYEQPLAGQLGPGATGGDGAIWFTGGTAEAVYRVDSGGTLRKFSEGLNTGSRPTSIASAPGGSLWFTDDGTTPAIGEIEPDGETPVVTEFPLPPASHPVQITAGPEGNMWFTDDGSEPAIGEIDPSGEVKEFPTRSGSHPAGITTGPDGDIWFTDDAAKPP